MFRLLTCLFIFLFSAGVQAEEPTWIDVRSAGEYSTGHVSGAVNIPHTEIVDRISEVTEDRDAPIYVYCRSGRRSGIARDMLEAQGYTNVINQGGLQEALDKAGEKPAR